MLGPGLFLLYATFRHSAPFLPRHPIRCSNWAAAFCSQVSSAFAPCSTSTLQAATFAGSYGADAGLLVLHRSKWGFPKLGACFLGGPIIRISIWRLLGSPYLGKLPSRANLFCMLASLLARCLMPTCSVLVRRCRNRPASRMNQCLFRWAG